MLLIQSFQSSFFQHRPGLGELCRGYSCTQARYTTVCLQASQFREQLANDLFYERENISQCRDLDMTHQCILLNLMYARTDVCQMRLNKE